MSLFGGKKKEKKEDVSFSNEIFKPNKSKSIPNLPELPKYESRREDFGDYDRELDSIKEQVGGGFNRERVEMNDIPIRKPKVTVPTLNLPNISPEISALGSQKPISQVPMLKPSGNLTGKPIFIKIEKYREALHNIENIKELCRNADVLLNEINRLREEENKELEKWRSDIGRIKDRLLLIDKKLFEG